jgi:hypothetical protein
MKPSANSRTMDRLSLRASHCTTSP